MRFGWIGRLARVWLLALGVLTGWSYVAPERAEAQSYLDGCGFSGSATATAGAAVLMGVEGTGCVNLTPSDDRAMQMGFLGRTDPATYGAMVVSPKASVMFGVDAGTLAIWVLFSSTVSFSPGVVYGDYLVAGTTYTLTVGSTAYTFQAPAVSSAGTLPAITFTRAPASLTYTPNPATYTVGTAITDNTPSSSGGAVTSYSVSPALPAGLILNTTTGVISGTPTAVTAQARYTVTATNSGGSTTGGCPGLC